MLTGYHTSIQVLVGFALGSFLASAWWFLGKTCALALIEASFTGTIALYGVTALAMLIFALKNLKL